MPLHNAGHPCTAFCIPESLEVCTCLPSSMVTCSSARGRIYARLLDLRYPSYFSLRGNNTAIQDSQKKGTLNTAVKLNVFATNSAAAFQTYQNVDFQGNSGSTKAERGQTNRDDVSLLAFYLTK